MTAINDQLRRLIEGLYLKTLEGKIEWTYDSDDDFCQAKIGNGFIRVIGETDDDGDYYNYIQLFDSDMQAVDSIYGGTFGRSIRPHNTDHRDYWHLISDLKAASKRSALGVDKIINNMLEAISAESLNIDDNIPF